VAVFANWNDEILVFEQVNTSRPTLNRLVALSDLLTKIWPTEWSLIHRRCLLRLATVTFELGKKVCVHDVHLGSQRLVDHEVVHELELEYYNFVIQIDFGF
jgi:hypothetical protein